MTPDKHRPLLIWLALAYLVVSLLLHLSVLSRLVDAYQFSTTYDYVFFVVAFGMPIIGIVCLIGIINRSSWGKRLAILFFLLLAILAIPNVVLLFRWEGPSPSQLLTAKILIFTRILSAFAFAVVFGVSQTIARYFDESLATQQPIDTDDD